MLDSNFGAALAVEEEFCNALQLLLQQLEARSRQIL